MTLDVFFVTTFGTIQHFLLETEDKWESMVEREREEKKKTSFSGWHTHPYLSRLEMHVEMCRPLSREKEKMFWDTGRARLRYFRFIAILLHWRKLGWRNDPGGEEGEERERGNDTIWIFASLCNKCLALDLSLLSIDCNMINRSPSAFQRVPLNPRSVTNSRMWSWLKLKERKRGEVSLSAYQSAGFVPYISYFHTPVCQSGRGKKLLKGVYFSSKEERVKCFPRRGKGE